MMKRGGESTKVGSTVVKREKSGSMMIRKGGEVLDIQEEAPVKG